MKNFLSGKAARNRLCTILLRLQVTHDHCNVGGSGSEGREVQEGERWEESGFRVQGSGLRVQGSWLSVEGAGLRVEG
jgi:hypothetical protein